MKRLIERMNSDKAASNTVETIIIIALAVFAGLALFTFVLRPIQQSSEGLGKGMTGFFGQLFENDGKGAKFDFTLGD